MINPNNEFPATNLSAVVANSCAFYLSALSALALFLGGICPWKRYFYLEVLEGQWAKRPKAKKKKNIKYKYLKGTYNCELTAEIVLKILP